MSMPFDLRLSLLVSSSPTLRSNIPTMELIISMGNWITEEANANNQREHDEANRQRLIRASNYWSNLVRQVEADVTSINEHPYWIKKLTESRLHFGEDLSGQGYQISKSGNPSVLVTFRNLGDCIRIERSLPEEVAQGFDTEEELYIGTLGQSAVLNAEGKRSFVIPEDASRYILKPVIETLKLIKNKD